MVSLINLTWLLDVWTTPSDLFTDFVYMGYYIAWLFAVSLVPHVRGHGNLEPSDRWLLAAGAILLSAFLFSYSILVPSRVAPEIYDIWVPSLLLFTCVDFILTLLLLRLMTTTGSMRWKILYGALAVNHFAAMMLDGVEALDYAGIYVVINIAASYLPWSIPFLIIVTAARLRNFRLPGSLT